MHAHIIDSRGVYLRTEEVDPMGPQPGGAVYESLPAEVSGKAQLWDGQSWQLVAEDEIPPIPEASTAEQVPQSCTRRQGLLALLAHDHRRSEIEILIGAIPDEKDREAAMIEYEAATWERSNPFLQQMWAALGGEPEQLDAVFRMAVTL